MDAQRNRLRAARIHRVLRFVRIDHEAAHDAVLRIARVVEVERSGGVARLVHDRVARAVLRVRGAPNRLHRRLELIPERLQDALELENAAVAHRREAGTPCRNPYATERLGRSRVELRADAQVRRTAEPALRIASLEPSVAGPA